MSRAFAGGLLLAKGLDRLFQATGTVLESTEDENRSDVEGKMRPGGAPRGPGVTLDVFLSQPCDNLASWP